MTPSCTIDTERPVCTGYWPDLKYCLSEAAARWRPVLYRTLHRFWDLSRRVKACVPQPDPLDRHWDVANDEEKAWCNGSSRYCGLSETSEPETKILSATPTLFNPKDRP